MRSRQHNIFTCNRILLVFVALFGFIRCNSYCRETLYDQELKEIKWSYLKECLVQVSGESLSRNVSENIWRLMKLAFDTIDSIPPDAFKSMGYTLIAIPMEDLRNISMESVDMVQIFGAISNSMTFQVYQEGFNADQLKLIAEKVRHEWLGKNPQTYSEYDLQIMGEILCYLNVSDIQNIHTDAFMEAAEWIGLIENCPHDRLEAFASLAQRSDAFGEPRKWSKLEVSIIGNILNGLTVQELNAISKDKLQLNHFYRPKGKNSQLSTNKVRSNSTNKSMENTNATVAAPTTTTQFENRKGQGFNNSHELH